MTRPIINTYEQLTEAVQQGIVEQNKAVYLSHYTSTGRDPTPSRWILHSPFFKTNPNKGHWMDYGNLSFSSNGKYRKALAEAQLYCKEKFGITEWGRNSTGDYVARVINKAVPIPKRSKP